MNEECGLFGVVGSPEAARDCYMGLHAQQHRGQESAGIATSSPGEPARCHRDLGLVTQVFQEPDLARLEGTIGIGHVRYSTAGTVSVQDAQPFLVTHRGKSFGIAHNGNLTNASVLRNRLEKDGAVFSTGSDTEVIMHTILGTSGDHPVQRVKQGLEPVRGAYSLLLLFDRGVVGVRDPHGFRPLYVGEKNGRYYLASETCGFDILNVRTLTEVAPGEGYYITPEGIDTFRLPRPAPCRTCSFEAIYFSRPDSLFGGESVHRHRIRLGERLWEEQPVEADVVTGVPDSANSATLGVARASGLPLETTLIRSHYTGRTFIAPYQEMRDMKVRQKFNLVPDAVHDKRVVLVDDSLVRGTTARKISRMFRDRGAREIHLRIASPRIQSPCYYGVDMPTEEELVVNRVDGEELADHLGVDTVAFLSIRALRSVVGENTCRGCFTGTYPTDVNDGKQRMKKQTPIEESTHVHV